MATDTVHVKWFKMNQLAGTNDGRKCSCGNPTSISFDPCCSFTCWTDRFEASDAAISYDELSTGDKLEMYHHWNTMPTKYSWQPGTILTGDLLGESYVSFVPDYRLYPTILIQPHRMDELRTIT